MYLDAILATLTPEECGALKWAWKEFWLRPDQRAPGAQMGTGQHPPPGNWIWWVIQGGRGSGKTTPAIIEYADEAHRLGTEFVGVLLCENDDEARKMIEDPKSGFLAILPPWKRPAWEPSIGSGLLTFPSGAVAHVMSAEKPSKGRSPNFNRWLIDDPPKFGQNAKALFDALARAFRLQGHGLKAYIATTPPGDPPPRCPELLDFFLDAEARGPDWVYSVSPSDANASNLDNDTKRVLSMFSGGPYEQAETQGIYSKDGGPRVFAAVNFSQPPIPSRRPARLLRVAVWIDPSLSSEVNACEVGIVAVGELEGGRALVLEDASGLFNAFQWPDAAIDCMERWEGIADAANFGVETNRRESQSEALLSTHIALRRQTAIAGGRRPRQLLKIVTVHTDKTKSQRASLLVPYYQAGNVGHLPGLAVFETQLHGLSTVVRKGPGADRADAGVYGLLDVFGLLDKVRPGNVGRAATAAPIGALGSTSAGLVAVGSNDDRFKKTLRPAAFAFDAPAVLGRSTF